MRGDKIRSKERNIAEIKEKRGKDIKRERQKRQSTWTQDGGVLLSSRLQSVPRQTILGVITGSRSCRRCTGVTRAICVWEN
jgi:hypothetical protein